jgi:lipopolysaccharide/colanic/teichoic acid biosynthesis glycosyltransferase
MITVEQAGERLGSTGPALGPHCRARGEGSDAASPGGHGERAFVISEADLAQFAQRPYWRLKRAIDLTGAGLLLILLAPFLALAAALAIIDVGYPFLFAQYRPGVGGRPFRLYKLRTMAAAHDRAGRRLPDAQRTSAIGRFLRRTRLDELPQLINILRGQMAFVGPRPLLPVDQPPAYAARLLVRPGLTGWAQVKGGREVSADNKAALDVWYLMHASLGLDLAILWHTGRMIVAGERINAVAIRDAWRDLRHAGVCSSTRDSRMGPMPQVRPC